MTRNSYGPKNGGVSPVTESAGLQSRSGQLDDAQIYIRGCSRLLTYRRCLIGISIFLLPILEAAGLAQATEVRISFLNDEGALRDTLAIVRAAGCEEEAIASFSKALEWYNSTPLALDLAHFPQKQNGFYVFYSMSQLMSALPHRLCDTDHPFQLNCFDAAILLTAGQLRTRLGIDSLAVPFTFTFLSSNGVPVGANAATPRDAFTRLHGANGYLEATDHLFPKQMLDDRVCISAALYGDYLLPSTSRKEKLGNAVLGALQKNWRRSGMVFPKHCEVILLHLVAFPRLGFHTDHAGVLFHNGNHLVYVEKSGGKGPFVRLDLDDMADLASWFGGYVAGAEKVGYTHYFFTINDKQIKAVQDGAAAR